MERDDAEQKPKGRCTEREIDWDEVITALVLRITLGVLV